MQPDREPRSCSHPGRKLGGGVGETSLQLVNTCQGPAHKDKLNTFPEPQAWPEEGWKKTLETTKKGLCIVAIGTPRQ